MTHPMDIDFSNRDPLTGLDPLFFQRWSPRAYSDKPVSAKAQQMVFEAARWTPSAFNEQPWRFITCTPGSHERFVKLLVDANQAWARHAPVIGFITSERRFAMNDNENSVFEFDAGAAWMAMTLQARMLGLYTHGMAGVHYGRVYSTLNINVATTKVICAFALGHIGDPAGLPEATRRMEQPSARKPLKEIWQQIDI
ncbi:MAG: nitroreductase family protein [Pseudomonadota bacterium]